MDEIINVFENNHVVPPWSHVFVLSLDAIAVLAVAWCVHKMVESRRAAALAKRIEETNTDLYEGARFVAGTVELEEGSPTAIRVTITQEGKEHAHRKEHTHTWTEIERQVDALPFYVRTTKGERIRVEPPLDVMLVDNLDQMEWTMSTWRRRRAELTAGERAVIEGRLERGMDPEKHGPAATYRTTTSTGWIMKPTTRRGMFVSTESLSRRHELRARAFAWATAFTIVLNITAMSVVIPYRARLLFGKTIVANYLRKEVFETRSSKGNRQKDYLAHVQFDNGTGLFSERMSVDLDDFQSLPTTPGRIWLRFVPAYPWATALGKTVSVASWQILMAATILGLSLYRLVRTHRYRRWYEGQLVESAPGTLPIPTNARFLPNLLDPRLEGSRPAAPVAEPISTDFNIARERQD